MPSKQPSPAWFALRRTLPTWNFNRNLRELVACLPRYKVDEVIVKIDTEEFSHGQPPLPWAQAYQANLFRIKRAMSRINVVYSINPWITMGHCDRGRDDRAALPGYRTVVGHDGAECSHCACPTSEVWRRHISELWTLYAETKPHVIWIEDDIRTFNHAPVSYGCFCPDHMRRFSERVGRTVTREELVTAMLQPGPPHSWRAIYLDMQAELMIETVSMLARVVHAVSPATCLGLMSSGPATHCLEGRRWHEFAAAMADGRALYSRPPLGNYSEDSLRGLYYSHDSIKITRHCMPAGAVELTEVENVPFTQYSKSANFTFLQIALSVAYGCRGASLNLFDHTGTPMEETPAFGRMLRDRKTWLNSLATACRTPGTYRGVRMLFHDRASYAKHLPPRANYCELAADGSAMMNALEAAGIPTTYDNDTVAATCGQVLRAFNDDEIRQLLAGGLLLDAEAARVLVERGFGPAIGLDKIEAPRHVDSLGVLSCEEFHNRRFGGAPRRYLTLTLPSLGRAVHISRLCPVEGAQIISECVDPDAQRVMPAMYAYENEVGGRVVVSALAFNTALGPAFHHPFRRMQLQGVVRWLARNHPAVLVNGDGAYPLILRKDITGTTILGLFNLTLDSWTNAQFEIADARQPAKAERLLTNGRWMFDRTLRITRKGTLIAICATTNIPCSEPLFIRLTWR